MFFLFARSNGITFAWMGEGFLKPFLSNHSRILEDNPKSLKVISVIGKNVLIKMVSNFYGVKNIFFKIFLFREKMKNAVQSLTRAFVLACGMRKNPYLTLIDVYIRICSVITRDFYSSTSSVKTL